MKENNERVYVRERYDKTKRLAGDPDCRLGVKKRSKQEPPAACCTSDEQASTGPSRKKKRAAVPSEPAEPVQEGAKKEKKELIWGYGTGVAALSPRHF